MVLSDCRTDPRDLREKEQDESTEVICGVKSQILIPDVFPPLLNFSMSHILMKLNSSITDSGCSSALRIIIISKEELCSVYTHVAHDELMAVCLAGDGNLRSSADDEGDVMHCILDEAGV